MWFVGYKDMLGLNFFLVFPMIIKTKFTPSELLEFLTKYLFLIIFPGYLLYNILVLYSLIPPIFGGYFGIFSFLAFVVYFFYSVYLIRNSLSASMILSIFGIGAFSIAALITAVSYLYPNPSATQQSLELLIFWLAFYGLGFYLVQLKANTNIKLLNYFIYAFFIYALYYVITSGKLMLEFGTSDVDNDAVSGYQGIARNILVIGFIIISYTQSKIMTLLKVLIVGILLFLIGARSEFFAFILSIFALQFILIPKSKSSFITIVATLAIGFAFVTANFDTLMESRQLQVFNLNQSNSWNERESMKALALKQIEQNPFLGDFGGHTKFGGTAKTPTGAYAHNSLSGYVNYGLIFFILYMLLIISAATYSALMLFKNPQNKDWHLCFMVTFTTLFLVLTAKPVFWPIIYLALGIFMGTLYKSKKSVPLAKIR